MLYQQDSDDNDDDEIDKDDYYDVEVNSDDDDNDILAVSLRQTATDMTVAMKSRNDAIKAEQTKADLEITNVLREKR
jgi:hypothetical protein